MKPIVSKYTTIVVLGAVLGCVVVAGGCDDAAQRVEQHNESGPESDSSPAAPGGHTHAHVDARPVAIDILRRFAYRAADPAEVEALCAELTDISTETLLDLLDHRDSAELADLELPGSARQMIDAVTAYRRLDAATHERATIAHLLSTGDARDRLEGFRLLGAQPDLGVVERAAIAWSRSTSPAERVAAGRLAGIVCAFGGAGDATDRVLTNLVVDRDPRVAYLTGVQVAIESRRPRVVDALVRGFADEREIPDVDLPWFDGVDVAGRRVGEQFRAWLLGRFDETAFHPWFEHNRPTDLTPAALGTWWQQQRDSVPYVPDPDAWTEDAHVLLTDVPIGVALHPAGTTVQLTVERCQDSWQRGLPVTDVALDVAYGEDARRFTRRVEYRGASDDWTGRSTFGYAGDAGTRLVHFRAQRLVTGRCRVLVRIWRRI